MHVPRAGQAEDVRAVALREEVVDGLDRGHAARRGDRTERALEVGLVVDDLVEPEQEVGGALHHLREHLHRPALSGATSCSARMRAFTSGSRMRSACAAIGEPGDREVRRTAHERVVAREAAEDPDRARRDLREELRAGRVHLDREVEHRAPRLGIVDVLHRRERDLLSGRPRDVGEQPELVILAEPLAAELRHVADRRRRDRLEHPAAAVGHARGRARSARRRSRTCRARLRRRSSGGRSCARWRSRPRPPRSPRATRRRISAMSSAVASSLRTPRSRITCEAQRAVRELGGDVERVARASRGSRGTRGSSSTRPTAHPRGARSRECPRRLP